MNHPNDPHTDIKVSVFIVAYNQADYIRNALDSALKQKTDFSFEILVHDDASTDGTKEIIQEYERLYPDQIIAFYESVNAYSHYWDYGDKMIRHARGIYMACCDGDDYWTNEHKLQIQYDFMESHPDYSLCVHNTRVIDMQTGETGLYANHKTGSLSRGYVIEHAGAVFHTSSHFFRLQEWRDRHSSKDVYDLARVCYLADEGKIMYFDNCMSVYRIHTKGSWNENVADKFNLISDYMGRLSFYKKFDEQTKKRWHKNIAKITNGIELQMFYDLREFYRDFRFRHRFDLLLAWTVDCFGLYPFRTWLRKRTEDKNLCRIIRRTR